MPTDISPENRFYFDSAVIGDTPSPNTDVDLYRLELIAGDRVSIDIDTPAGDFSFDSILRVFDGAGIQRGFSDDNASPGESPSLDAWIEFVAPHTGSFFVGVSGFGNFDYSPFIPGGGTPGSTGSYDLNIELLEGPGEPGPPPLEMPGEGVVIDVFNDFIESPGSVDVFAIPIFEDGLLHVRQIADFGSGLDPFLQLLTPTGDVIATNNNDAVSLNSLIEVPVESGSTVLVEAGGFSGTTGDYQVVVSFHSEPPGIFEEPLIVPDVVGNDLENAETLELDNTGAGFVDGQIEAPGDRDVFRIETAQNGLLRITQTATPGSPLDTFVRVLNSEGSVIAQNDDDGVSLNSLVQFPVSAGTVLFVEAGAFGGSTGAYRIDIEPGNAIADDFGNTTADASPLTLGPMGRGQRPGAIEFAGDRDVFQVTTRQASLLSIRQRAVPGSGLDSILRVRDENGVELAFNDDNGSSLNSLLQIPVVENQTLFIEAGAFGSSRGRYELIVSAGNPVTDDAGDNVAAAVSLNLNAAAPTIRRGNIDRPGDRDVFRIVPANTGLLTIRQRADGGNPLDTFVRVLDANGDQLAANDDDGFSLNSRVSVLATGGEALFIEAGAFGQSAGSYVVEIETQAGVTDDFGNDIASAHTTAGVAELRGEIELSGDVDVFQVQATETGLLTIRQRATRGSSIDSFLRILDSTGQVLAVNDDDRFSLNSVATVAVTAGDTIYVESGAFSTSTGRYVVALESGADDFTDVLNDTTTAIELSSEGSGARSGVINFEADADVFRFTPASDSVVTIDLRGNAAASLDPFLQIFSSSEELILVDDDSGEGLDSRATFDAKAGETYFVRATSFGGTTGAYQLQLTSSFELDDVGNTFPDARQFVLDESGSGSSQFQLNGRSDVDVFQFTATVSGRAALRVGQEDGTAPGRVFVFGETDDSSDSERSRIRVARDQDNDGLVSFSVTEGTTYYVEVAQGSGLTDLSVTTDTTAEDESKIDEDVASDAADLFRLGLASILVGEADDSALDVFAATLEETAALVGDKLGTDEAILILGLDPVDYIVTDSAGRQAGFTATAGEINEVGSNVFNSGDGVAELLIVRNPAADVFQLDLVGVGTDFRGGAAYITSDGIQTTTFDGTLTKGNLEVALDFSNSESTQQTQSTETIQVGNFLASISDDIGDRGSDQVSRLDGSSQSTEPEGLSTDEFAALVEDLSASVASHEDAEGQSNSEEATGEAAASLNELIGSLLGWLDGDDSDEDSDAEDEPVDRTWRSVAQSVFQFSSSAIELMTELLQATTEKADETEQAKGEPGDPPDESNTAAEESDGKEPKRVSSNEVDESSPEGPVEGESDETKPVKTARATAVPVEEVVSKPRTAT